MSEQTESKEAGLLERMAETFLKLITSTKAGARHSTSDRTDIQTVHDIAVKQGAECDFKVYKAADGKRRWVLYSSSAYEDRDAETIALKAHEADIAHMRATGDYGVLRWGHKGAPVQAVRGDWRSYKAGRGWDLGVCDFAALEGLVVVESGTFYDEEVGAAFERVTDRLDVSKGFSHPPDQPDREGTFSDIHTFERSLLRKGRASNRLVGVPYIASTKEAAMDQKERDELAELIGSEHTDKIIAQAKDTQAAANTLGLKFKNLDPEAVAIKEEAPPPPPAEAPAPEAAPDEERKVGDLSMAELKAYIGECMAAYDASKTTKEAGELATFKETVIGQVNGITEAVNKHGRRLKTLEGDAPVSVNRKLRASEAEETVTEKDVKGMGPKADPTMDLLDQMLGIDMVNKAMNGTPPVPIK